MKVKIKKDRRHKGITHLREEQQETHPGTLESFYEQEIIFIRSHKMLVTAAKAEYLTKNLKNEQQNLANTCRTQQLSATQHFEDKHETLQDALKGLFFMKHLTSRFKKNIKSRQYLHLSKRPHTLSTQKSTMYFKCMLVYYQSRPLS